MFTANPTKTYGDVHNGSLATGAFTFDSSLLNAGDSFTGLTFTSAGTAANANVGSYGLTFVSAAGTFSDLSAYNFSFSSGSALAVNARTLTLSASKTYDGTTGLSGAVTLGNLANSENLTYTGATASNQNVATTGKYISAITLAAGTGTTAGRTSNYVLPTLDATNAPVTIEARAINLTANSGQKKIYGNVDPTLSYTLEAAGSNRGLVGTDSFTGALSRATGENVGSAYAINQGDVANSNYAISYTGANFAIEQRAITLAATATGKTYGNVDPTLAVSISGGSLGNATVSDTLADVTGTLSREAGENVGSYDIALGSGAKAANYAITYVTDNNAVTIGQRAITVTADAKTKIYAEVNPALTYTLTSGNLVNNDTYTGALETSAKGNSVVGNYAITQGDLSLGANYALSFVPAILEVTERAVTLSPLEKITTINQAVAPQRFGKNTAKASAWELVETNTDPTIEPVSATASPDTSEGDGSALKLRYKLLAVPTASL